jgi:hypothetical protein
MFLHISRSSQSYTYFWRYSCVTTNDLKILTVHRRRFVFVTVISSVTGTALLKRCKSNAREDITPVVIEWGVYAAINLSRVWQYAVNCLCVRRCDIRGVTKLRGSKRNLCCELCSKCVLFFQVSDTSWICADGLREQACWSCYVSAWQDDRFVSRASAPWSREVSRTSGEDGSNSTVVFVANRRPLVYLRLYNDTSLATQVLYILSSQFSAAVSMKMTILWRVAPCSLVKFTDVSVVLAFIIRSSSWWRQ